MYKMFFINLLTRNTILNNLNGFKFFFGQNTFHYKTKQWF
jgi:hypothetical protein